MRVCAEPVVGKNVVVWLVVLNHHMFIQTDCLQHFVKLFSVCGGNLLFPVSSRSTQLGSSGCGVSVVHEIGDGVL